MGQRVSLFSGYDQGENRTTNYCLLLMQLMYSESPGLLGEFLTNLVGEEVGSRVGVQFHQQVSRGSSVPDGLISQAAFQIFIETKESDWFHDDQLEQHLNNMKDEPGLKILLALSNFETDTQTRFSHIKDLCRERYSGSVAFRAATFEEFLAAIPTDSLPRSLQDVVKDFRSYLDNRNLLPRWKDLLDVVNCVRIPEDIERHGVYICPAAGGAYNHARCKYFGMYGNKRVSKVALIRGVVEVYSEDAAKMQWSNADETQKSLEAEAIEKIRAARGEYPSRVFLLGDLCETNFVKDSRGGMMGSKQYFDIGPLGVADAADLAEKLRGKTWTWLSNQGR
jgi:uncharacterized membrane protein